MPKVSIVIPIYNVSAFIEKCIKSIVNQSYRNIEIILIDDCGSDNSINIAKTILKDAYKELDVKIIKHPFNKGLSAARNTGIQHATGEYIYFVDSDDFIDINCIYNLTRPIIESKKVIDFIIGDYQVLNPVSKYPSLNLEVGLYLGKEIPISYINKKWYMMAWNKLINLNFLRKNNIYFKEGILHEDLLWSFQLACCAHSMYVVKQKTYTYLIREGSITQNYTYKNINSIITIIKECSILASKVKNIPIKYLFNHVENLKFDLYEKIFIILKRKEILKIYKETRYITPYEKNHIKWMLQTNPFHTIRNLHHIFPQKIGFIYLYILIKSKLIIRNAHRKK